MGKSTTSTLYQILPSDHPHGCGEKHCFGLLSNPITGSSPRVWGKAVQQVQVHFRIRIIPTGVGKRYVFYADRIRRTDHPHGCGEKHAFQDRKKGYNGSSPRVWGKGLRRCSDQSRIRIIPTGVGKRLPCRLSKSLHTDHPHGCGEKEISFFDSPQVPGSSPRVWGKGRLDGIDRLPNRIIPTGVGKSGFFSSNRPCSSDHPHGCGEKDFTKLQGFSLNGSSPRVWGKVPSRSRPGVKCRIIPTGVGKR